MTSGNNDNSMCSPSGEIVITEPMSLKHTEANEIRRVSTTVNDCIKAQEEEKEELESLERLLNRLTVVNEERREKAKSVRRKMDNLSSKL